MQHAASLTRSGQVAAVRTGPRLSMMVPPVAAHQVALDLHKDAPATFVMESAAFELHHWRAETGVVSPVAYAEQYPGPVPVLPDPDDTGGPPA